MSTFWSGADRDLLEKLDRRLQESDIATVSSVSTNATASDLCGPGRTLGLAFRYLGRKLETALSRTLEKRGFGPIPTSERIIQRSEKLRTFGYDIKDGGKIAEKIKRKLHSYLLENDCRRLLKYLQSEVLSNQLLAIDSVVDVSLRNAYARSILHELQVAPVLARVSLMAEREVGAAHLAIRSRRALICVEDNYVNAVMRELQLIVLNDTITGTYYVGIPKSFIHPSIYSTPLLEYLLQDGKLSFVVLRFFHDLLTSICTPEHPAGRNSLDELLWNIHGWLPRFLSNLKGNVDWMSLDRVLHFLVSQMYEDATGEGITMRYCDYQALDLILRKPDGLPRTASYILDNVTALCAPPFFDFAEKAEETCSVVKELSGIAVDDLSEKIDLRDLLREFPCLVGAWMYMHGAYFPLCVFVEIVRQRGLGYGLSPAGPRGKFQALAREVARHQFMNWDEVVQKHVLIVASFNRYCRIVLANAFEEVFADPDITATLSASSTRSMSETWKKRLYDLTWNFDFIEIEKHCSADGSFLHFCQPEHKNPRFCTDDRGSICYKARIPRSHVTGLKLKPGEKLDSSGHYPLYAFTNAKGKKQYITELDSPYFLYHGTIEDGASETQYWDENGVLRKSGRMRFKVLMSRWDPDPTEEVVNDPLTWELYDPNEGARLVEIEDEKSSIGSQEIYEDTI